MFPFNLFKRFRIEEPEASIEEVEEAARLERIAEEGRRKRERLWLFEALAPDISRMFEEYPKVIDWCGESLDYVTIAISDPSGFPVIHAGRIITDADGNIDRWEEYPPGRKVFKRVTPTLSEEKRVAQITGMLADSDSLSRYCEQVAATLLEEGSCIFNVPFSLKVKEAEYNKRYGAPEWETSWIEALKAEFQASGVIPEGNGCFRLEAL